MADDDDHPNDVMDAAHAAIGGVQAAIEGLGARLDTLVETQQRTLEHIIRLEPVKAIESELDAPGEVLDPSSTDPPSSAPNETEKTASPLRKFHNVLG